MRLYNIFSSLALFISFVFLPMKTIGSNSISVSNQPIIEAIPSDIIDLPMGSSPTPEITPHFPTRLHTFVWRNWNLVELGKLAKILQTTPDKVVKVAVSMGLPAYKKPTWSVDQIYITLIRRNWHLLPYEQILQLVDMSPERLNFALREDDFLWIKLGMQKPICEPLVYKDPTDKEIARAKEIKNTLNTLTGKNILPPSGEPRFAFIDDLKEVSEKRKTINKENDSSLRFIYSYFAIFGDPLSKDDADLYPDGLLQKLSNMGVNGVWLHVLLREMAPGGNAFPEFGEGHETRIRNLRKLVERAKKYNINIYLYLNEPRAMPASFFDKQVAGRETTKGVKEGEYYALCTSDLSVRNWIKNALAYIFEEIPQLGGVFSITGSENLTYCNSHGKHNECPHCSQKSGAEVTADVNKLFAEGVHRSAPDAKVIVWDWGWNGHSMATDVIELLPDDVWFMSVSEWALPIERGGVKSTVGEYSISSVGPGPRAKEHWRVAKEKGLKTAAKVQFNCTWEIASIPYVPVMDLVAEHSRNLVENKVDGFLLSWSLGGYPSPNLEIPERFYRTPLPSVDEVLNELAVERYGEKAASLVRKSWSVLSDAYREYPYSGSSVYSAPTQMGPANLFRMQPTGYKATMVGIPYDDVASWCSFYPAQTFAQQFEKMASGFADGIEYMEQAVSLVSDKEKRNNLKQDLRYAQTARIHFASVANQVHFTLLRNTYLLPDTKNEEKAELTKKMKAIVEEEIKLTKELYLLSLEDSCIGFESSNHYFYVPNDLLEKLISCQQILNSL